MATPPCRSSGQGDFGQGIPTAQGVGSRFERFQPEAGANAPRPFVLTSPALGLRAQATAVFVVTPPWKDQTMRPCITRATLDPVTPVHSREWFSSFPAMTTQRKRTTMATQRMLTATVLGLFLAVLWQAKPERDGSTAATPSRASGYEVAEPIRSGQPNRGRAACARNVRSNPSPTRNLGALEGLTLIT